MRILVVGAYGFIGMAVTARLAADGHEVIGAGRRIRSASYRRPDLRWLRLDLSRTRKPGQWKALLDGIDAVVNCAGVLQDKPGDSTQKVHVTGAGALFEACAELGIRRVVQVSAVGVSADARTKFARTKFAAEERLKQLDLDWVILRPSLVVGRTAYGGTALLRAVAAIPLVLPLTRESASAQPVQVRDLARAVSFFVQPGAPARQTIEIAGPERMPLRKIIVAYRRWLGFRPAEIIRLPPSVATTISRLGDVVSWLGWRPPFRTTALQQLSHAFAEDPDAWTKITGIKPERFETALQLDPASAQDRWFAYLYLLKPVVIVALVAFWFVSAVIGLGPAREIAAELLKEVGFGRYASLAADFSGVLHLLIGLGIAFRPTARTALIASLPVILIYIAAGSLMRIGLWLDPLGALIKMIPILALTLVAIAILDDR
jgi:uncharacterized protein YbjT (DUF2867 family)